MFARFIRLLAEMEHDVMRNFAIYQKFNNFALVKEVFNIKDRVNLQKIRKDIEAFYNKYQNIERISLKDTEFYRKVSLSLFPESDVLKPVEVKQKVLEHLDRHGNLPAFAWSFKRKRFFQN